MALTNRSQSWRNEGANIFGGVARLDTIEGQLRLETNCSVRQEEDQNDDVLSCD